MQGCTRSSENSPNPNPGLISTWHSSLVLVNQLQFPNRNPTLYTLNAPMHSCPLQYPLSPLLRAQLSSLLGGPESLALSLLLSPPLSCWPSSPVLVNQFKLTTMTLIEVFTNFGRVGEKTEEAGYKSYQDFKTYACGRSLKQGIPPDPNPDPSFRTLTPRLQKRSSHSNSHPRCTRV